MNLHNYVFRFDDISLNTDECKLRKMIDFLENKFQDASLSIILAVSPAVHSMRNCDALEMERVFPSLLHTESEFQAFYKVNSVGIPRYIMEYRGRIGFQIAAHGLIHVDHRLLTRSAQELSILTSCSLLGTRLFVPPFHKWNEKTEEVCRKHGIELIKFDSALWKHLKYHKFQTRETNYYLHTHDFTYEQFVGQFS